MIDVYTWATPNGHKVHVMLEECGLPYTVHAVDIGAGDQFKPDFLAISPNNKIPAIVDSDGPDGKPISLFESGAILVYLAAKTGKFMPDTDRGRYEMLEWLMFQMGGVGPMLGQAHHFRLYAPEKIEYAVNRYTNEAHRLYGVMDKRLGQSRFLAGDQYTIADIATWPWTRSHANQGIDPRRLPERQALVRHDRRTRCRAARRPGARQGTQAADRRQVARPAVRRRPVREALASCQGP